MTVDVDRHYNHGIFKYNIFLFLAFSLPCGKYSGLICLICDFAHGHVGKFPPFMGLKPNMVVRLSSAI